MSEVHRNVPSHILIARSLLILLIVLAQAVVRAENRKLRLDRWRLERCKATRRNQEPSVFQAEHVTFSTSNGSFVESINSYSIWKELNSKGHIATVFNPTSNGLPPNSLHQPTWPS